MKISLKDLAAQKEILRFVIQILGEDSKGRVYTKRLNKLMKFVEEIETDLELGGECIIELDKGRLESIEERNKFLKFLEHDEP